MEIAAVIDSLSPSSEAMHVSDADVLVVDCGDEYDQAIELVGWWSDNRAGRPVIVVCRASSNGFVQRALGAGADDLVVVDSDPTGAISDQGAQHIVFAIEKAAARRRPPATPAEIVAPPPVTEHGAMICVLGPKGGIGKTITSSNLAVALATDGQRVVLVDLDLQFGDVALALGLRPERTIYDLAVSGGSLDAEKLDAYLMRHPTGLRVLAAPLRPDQASTITPEFLADVTAELRRMFDFLIVDTPPAFTPEVIGAIDASTDVCMVGMLDAPSLKNTRLGLETLELMGYPDHRITLVLNRANTSVGITGSDVESILGRTPDVLVPSHRDVARSVNAGEPIVLTQRRSEAGRAFTALASSFVPSELGSRRRRLSFGRRRREG
jgi:pilus assembly protein CpaE